MHLTTTHPVRWLIAVVAAAAMFVAVGVTDSHANSPVDCDDTDPNLSHTVSPVTGGSLIQFSTSCTGQGEVNLSVEVTTVNFDNTTQTWFAAVDNRQMTGQFTASRAIHLPVKVPGKVCLTVNGNIHCVPPS